MNEYLKSKDFSQNTTPKQNFYDKKGDVQLKSGDIS